MVKEPINGYNKTLLVDPKMRKKGKIVVNNKLQVEPKLN
jgi:hypothetical protein